MSRRDEAEKGGSAGEGKTGRIRRGPLDAKREGRTWSFALCAACLCLASLSSCSHALPSRADDSRDKPQLKEETIMSVQKKPLVIAHRGYRAIAPENTLEAARKGREAGAEMWELDVAETTDGVLVVIHDDTLQRTTDAKKAFPGRAPWSVYDFSLAEIKSLDAGSWYGATDPFKQIAAGKVGPAQLESFRGIGIPTLEESLLLTKELAWSVNIEIKDATGHACDPGIVEKTVALVERLGMTGSVLISSFNHDYLYRVKKAAPGMAVAALTDNNLPDIVGRLRSLKALAWHPNGRKIDENSVRAVRGAGFDVNVWTVNEDADMKRMIPWGITGIITDYTERARALVDLTEL
jgi:glycerophosphoryl diester phosphodiesterase